MDGRHARTGQLRRAAQAAAAVVVALTVVGCTGEEPSAPRTAAVTRGSVTTGVSASGSMSAISQQNLGFRYGGQLTNVFVKVGDRVEAGQVLATLDDFFLRQVLAERQGQLRSQQAVLDRLINSPVVEGAQDAVSQAEEILDATRRQAKAVLNADEVAIDNAERQLATDREAHEEAEDRLERDREACGDSAGDGSEDDEDSSEASLPVLDPTDPACSAAEAAVTAAEQKVTASENTLDSAVEKRDVDKANGDIAIANAEQALVSARNSANSEESDRPFDIEQQRGVVVTAQAALAAAQRDLDDATLRAPVAGTVSALNGAVGEYLTPSNGTSALAPGSGAAIPGVESPSAAQAAMGAVANPARPGGTQFLVLDDIDAFQVVAPFNESDAARIAANQKANVSVDAIPDLTLTGTVLAVAPSGTAVSGVVNFYVTMIISGNDPRLKDGQTVRATVVTEEIGDVLTVPSAAVRQEDGRATVTVVEPGGAQKPVPFDPGVVGPDRTQVISGLREGQQVLLPAAR
ncbi:HlyD family secretion protein [Pseudonocardia hierapolitana]|uniref:HlyD family secretion protein n=1 Tax=Pseudonocardia hierapolitana TaxID=1128676 RepID=A0A561T062_9PSEU|nr:HlyD family efflux transporter periplasmic adaptor subunit [Pseudonocardia hierapolitana]TWF80503.1 HlyD family secretion protein [Pseudonocardia hierapolitana]